MEKLAQLSESYTWLMPLLIILAVWEGIWKLAALWKSAGKKRLVWFLCIAIFNTIGILPIIYIFFIKETGNIYRLFLFGSLANKPQECYNSSTN